VRLRSIAIWLGAALLASAAAAAPLPKQIGLPPELVISDQPPLPNQLTGLGLVGTETALAKQATLLEKMAEYVKQTAPKPGLLDKLGSMFGAGSKIQLISLPQLAALAATHKGEPMLLAVQGVFEAGADASVGSFSSGGTTCVLALGPAVARDGLPQGSLEGLPIRAEGTAQVAPNGLVTLQVARLAPGGSLVSLRVGRVDELQGQNEPAVAAYKEAASEAQGEAVAGIASEFAPFAEIRAADLTLNQLHDDKAARTLYAGAWQLFTKQIKGVPVYTAWVQTPDGDWKQSLVADAVATPLKALNENLFWYKLVAGFVSVCGGNPGLALILLAIVSRMLVYPLTKKQLASARDMQRLQPMMKALQEKHKDDKQKFQEEFWKLCQEHGVNPLGGCLPLIVQMPLMIAVYSGVRAYMVNLDHASFLWVHSLAQPDLWLLGIYTISQIGFGKVTQSQNPTAAVDPQQKQQQQMMTYMMPLMFFFIFQSFPAAFMLYWLGLNLAYLAQTLYYNKTAPPLDRPLTPKPAGGGGGFLAKMMAGPAQPSDKEQRPSDQSFDARKAAAEGKMLSKEDAKARRKKKRWKRPQ
jgi:YidC/Oxa1 family membrane protein insertase